MAHDPMYSADKEMPEKPHGFGFLRLLFVLAVISALAIFGGMLGVGVQSVRGSQVTHPNPATPNTSEQYYQNQNDVRGAMICQPGSQATAVKCPTPAK